jgi:hypothetical protein
VLRRIFGPKKDEMVIGGWRKLQVPPSVYSSPDIIRLIKAKRIR